MLSYLAYGMGRLTNWKEENNVSAAIGVPIEDLPEFFDYLRRNVKGIHKIKCKVWVVLGLLRIFTERLSYVEVVRNGHTFIIRFALNNTLSNHYNTISQKYRFMP